MYMVNSRLAILIFNEYSGKKKKKKKSKVLEVVPTDPCKGKNEWGHVLSDIE